MRPPLAVRVYRACLATFPPAHRARYADEMVALFHERWAAVRAARGAVHAAWFALRAVADALGAGLGERRRHSGQRVPRDRWMTTIRADLRFALRSLASSWMFTIVCVVSLGAGLGVAHSVLLLYRVTMNPPYELDADGLVEILVREEAELDERWSYPAFQSFEELAELSLVGWAVGEGSLRPEDGAPAERITASYVSGGYFDLLEIPPLLGRGFTAADEESVEGTPVVLGWALWRNRFGADPGVLGRVLTVNRTPHVIVGVAPPGVRSHRVGVRSDLFLPLSAHPSLQGPSSLRHADDAPWVRILGRLRDGATPDQAATAVAARAAALQPTRSRGRDEVREGVLLPYRWQGARVGEGIWALQAAFGGIITLFLFVVCLNVAGMVTVRTATREHELALRQALGSDRVRLVRLLMTESVLLALAGGLLAVGAVWATLQGVSWKVGQPLPASARLDTEVAILSLGLALSVAIVFGLTPALQFSRPQFLPALREGAGSGRRRAGRIHRLAAAVQTGLTVPALVVAAAVAQGAHSLTGGDFGVQSENLQVLAPVDLAAEGYDAGSALALAREIVRSTLASGDVAAAAFADGVPLDGIPRGARVEPVAEGVGAWAQVTRIGPGYFEALGISPLAGRAIRTEDRAGAEPVAVLSDSLAARMFPGRTPLGARIRLADQAASTGADVRNDEPIYTVVGVVPGVAGPFLESPTDHVFLAIEQDPRTTLALVLRSTGSGGDPATSVQRIGASLDPHLARLDLAEFETIVEARGGDLRDWTAFFGFVGALLLLLSATGIYGIVAFAVVNRTREIGIRMSLGSSRRRVLATVVADGLRLAAPGLVLGGLVGTLVGEGLLNRMYAQIGLPLAGPAMFVLAPMLALLIVLLASAIPARRAARVDPMAALRSE